MIAKQEAIKTILLEIELTEARTFIESMDNWLLAVIEKSHYIKMWRT